MKTSSKTNLYILIFSSIFLFSCHREHSKRFKDMQSAFLTYIIVDEIETYGNSLIPQKDFYFKKKKHHYSILFTNKDDPKTRYSLSEVEMNEYNHHFSLKEGWKTNGKRIRVDSLNLSKKILKFMKIGGCTEWSNPKLVVKEVFHESDYISYKSSRNPSNTIHYPLSEVDTYPPPYRMDFMIYYYIYYGLFKPSKEEEYIHELKLVDAMDSSYSCSCSPQEDTVILKAHKYIRFEYGKYALKEKKSLLEMYDKLPPSKCNSMLKELYVCYQKWLAKVEKTGWEVSRILEYSPFDDCPCRIERIDVKDNKLP